MVVRYLKFSKGEILNFKVYPGYSNLSLLKLFLKVTESLSVVISASDYLTENPQSKSQWKHFPPFSFLFTVYLGTEAAKNSETCMKSLMMNQYRFTMSKGILDE